MNEQTLKGKWKEIKGEIQRVWGNLTGDELDKAEGDMKSIAGIIQQKYGAKKEEVSTRLNEIVDRYGSKLSNKTEDAKERLKH